MRTYRQILGIVNGFMEESGIRALCTDVCQGGCCSFQRERKFGERDCQGRLSCHDKLPCVYFLCNELRLYLTELVPAVGQFLDRGWEVSQVIMGRRVKGNLFFAPYSLEEVESLSFPDIAAPEPRVMLGVKKAIADLRAETQSNNLRSVSGRRRIDEAIYRLRRRNRGWVEWKDRFELKVGRYDLVVFKNMFDDPNRGAPTIYTNHSGQTLICESLDREAAWKIKTLDEAKGALIERFKEIIAKEKYDFEAFWRQH